MSRLGPSLPGGWVEGWGTVGRAGSGKSGGPSKQAAGAVSTVTPSSTCSTAAMHDWVTAVPFELLQGEVALCT
jgi:hypothetical protein